ncbi:MAG: GTPase HflX [Deltaproteobacteria bacterium]|nr:GTPase HflX [Deltaproteobacteria bacterium]
MTQPYGNTTGLKSSQLKALERIYQRRVPTNEVVTPELARYMTELSREIKRQIGVIIDRKGVVAAVIAGDEKEIVIPLLPGFPLGKKRLRGIRCIHTHLKDEPLSRDDLTDLALLRLDLMAAVGVLEDGLPGRLYMAHLLPHKPQGAAYETLAPASVHSIPVELDSFLHSLEDEIVRASRRNVSDKRERAILVSVAMRPKDEQNESLEELSELAATAGIVVLDTVSQRPERLNPKYLMGTGKIKELIITALQKEATIIVFNQELTPTQIRELAAVTELKVIDRTQLILDIFASRAHSRDGKVQVELAQLKYLLPKLTGKGAMMSRLMGGIGGRGPGETKLEVDRRRVGDRIAHLEHELKSLSRGRFERRRRRAASGIPIISICGYTNAGKSTLLNALTASATLVEDKLFATLDTATRRLRFPRERDAVITDTVGFIRDLPSDLMAAFKSTLEEMEDADLLMHLVDVSNPHFEKRIETVEAILEEIGLGRIPRLLVFNKADLIEPAIAGNLSARFNAVPISALNTSTLRPLLKELELRLWPGEEIQDGQ